MTLFGKGKSNLQQLYQIQSWTDLKGHNISVHFMES